MTDWTSDELEKIGHSGELEITTVRRDGTPRKPVTIWVVRDGQDLYVRSGYGNSAAWYRRTQLRREGRIKAGGIEKDVAFADADPSLNDRIDAAYRAKYRRHGARWSIRWWPPTRAPRRLDWCRGKHLQPGPERALCPRMEMSRRSTFA